VLAIQSATLLTCGTQSGYTQNNTTTAFTKAHNNRGMVTPPRSVQRGRPAPSSTSTPNSAVRGSARARAEPRAEKDEEKKGSRLGLYAAIAVGVVVIVAVFSVGPIRHSLALQTLNNFKGSNDSAGAIAAADAYLALSGGHDSTIIALIRQDTGPVNAQIYLAKKLRLFASLLSIAERPLSTSTENSTEKNNAASITQDDRIAALHAAADIFHSTKHKDDILPDALKKWTTDKDTPVDVALASLRVILAVQPKYMMPLLSTLSSDTQINPALAGAAIDGLTGLCDADNLGLLLALYTGSNHELALTHKSTLDKIIALANSKHVPALMDLLNAPKESLRTLALNALGGPMMRLGDTAEHLDLRNLLSKRLIPQLRATTPANELAATLNATRGLRLHEATDAVMALIPAYKALNLPNVDDNFFADILGRAFITTVALPDPPKDGTKPSAQDAIANALRARSDAIIQQLIAGLENENTRTVCAKSLGLIRDKTYPGLRDAVEKLVHYGKDSTCMDAIHLLVDKTYGRDDVTKLCARSVEKWEKYLASDRPNYERVKNIVAWMKENGKYQTVSDGRTRLGKNKEYLTAAQAELDSWMSDPKFLPPLGLTRNRIEALNQDVKMMGMNVRKAWSGAM
jgi:hypothetical protein